jgi:hypothetical protein
MLIKRQMVLLLPFATIYHLTKPASTNDPSDIPDYSNVPWTSVIWSNIYSDDDCDFSVFHRETPAKLETILTQLGQALESGDIEVIAVAATPGMISLTIAVTKKFEEVKGLLFSVGNYVTVCPMKEENAE